MQGQIIYIIIIVFQCGSFPLRESRHLPIRTSTGYQLDGRIDQFHGLARFLRDPSVFVHSLAAQLPRAIHLITQAPQFDIIGIFHTVGSAKVAIFGAAGMVAIFQQIAGICHTSGTQIHCHHDLCIHLLRPMVEFLQSEGIRLQRSPRQIQSGRTLIHRAYTVLPEKVGYEVTTGITDQGNLQFSDQLYHVLSVTVFVRRGMSRLVDTAVHRPAQMLNKGTEQTVIHLRHLVCLI